MLDSARCGLNLTEQQLPCARNGSVRGLLVWSCVIPCGPLSSGSLGHAWNRKDEVGWARVTARASSALR
jgi:hypothetical protein